MSGTETPEFSMSKLSLHSNESGSGSGSQTEDWDRSLNVSGSEDQVEVLRSTTTPRNSVLFPADGPEQDTDPEATPGKGSLSKGTNGRLRGKPKRSLTELIKLQRGEHGEGPADLSSEEASHVADVLGQWINAGSSPYEGDDDFFARRSHDDLSISSRLSPHPDGRARTVSAASSSSRTSRKGDPKSP